MLNIEINEDQLKKTTEDYFNIYYMYLLFSDTDTMQMSFKDAKLVEDRIILLADKTVSYNSVYDEGKSRAKNSRFNEKPVVETICLDYDYLLEIGNSNGLELKLDRSDENSTEINYELSWANKEKFTKINIPKRNRIY